MDRTGSLPSHVATLSEIVRDESRLALAARDRSEWSVAMHVEHTLLVLRTVLDMVHKGVEVEGPPMSLMARIVLLTGRIPRGRAKAPDRVQPRAIPPAELQALCGRVEGLLASLPELRRDDRVFQHPFLGVFSSAAAVRFADIHTGHHLRIIAAIERAAQGS